MEEYFPTFEEACKYIKNLPYKRNMDKNDVLCVLKDNGGTCSTKHAFLKRFSISKNIANVKLMLGIFMMKKNYHQRLVKVLEKYGLEEMPEAHNYLRINGVIHDYTTSSSKPEDFIGELVTEIEIQPEQITDFKINYHKDFLLQYLQNRPSIRYSLDEFWKIREECIAALQK